MSRRFLYLCSALLSAACWSVSAADEANKDLQPERPRRPTIGQDAEDHQADRCSTRPRPTRFSRPWRCSRRTIPGTWLSKTGRCTPTRRTSSPRSAPTSRSATTPTWASSWCRPTRRRSTSRSSATPASRTRGRSRCRTTCPIEGWPANYKRTPQLRDLTLDDVQRDKLKEDGDRHAIVVDPVNRMLYEFYQREEDRRRLAGGAGVDLRSEVEQAAARRTGPRPTRPACRSSPPWCATTN